MTNEKIFTILNKYSKFLNKKGYKSRAIKQKLYYPNDIDAMGHVLVMIPRIKQFIKEERREKAFRWLGFVQGILWSYGEYTIEELRDHNKI